MKYFRILLAALCLVLAGPSMAQDMPRVKFAVNPGQLVYLPLFVAVDKGYFRDAGVDVQVIKYKGSANTQMPMLARGDIDISSVVVGPAMFNQIAEGFGIRLVAALTEPKAGYQDGVVMVVRKDLWDSKAIRKPADLKGHKVDGAAEGNPIDFLVRHALANAGLATRDVTLSYKPRSASDTPEILRQKVVDVAGVSEPTATLIERDGIGVRWLSYKDVIPWYQDTFLATSEGFLRDHPHALRRFLAGYLRAVKDVSAAQGNWTPELLATAKKWTGMSEELIRSVGKLPYWAPEGAVNLDSLERVQQFWVKAGLVKTPIAVTRVVETGAIVEAKQNLRTH
jgi:ABC-type nitrate/sulfonate/bicarbonate transport system substrate-binding protein